ncbi:BTAD domain-containing putative transcriptional regulator [Tsukamurella ocularis]|uniref:BTAD domain-containing putative transcriptional regulator n=1 Tax=Tsukamurella ocularis TaxID=1970234 RepID=UPI0039F0FE80
MDGTDDGRGAVAAATAAVRRDPLCADAHRALARAHLAAGDLCQARAAVQRYAQVTRRELGAEPAADLWALVGLPSWTHVQRPAGSRAG